MLHGFAEGAEVWDFLLPYLNGPWQIFAIDQRGHGLSDRAPEGHYTTFHFVGDIEDFAITMGLQKFSLVGHSMGGRNALVYAALHPDRVERLVVIDYGPELAAEGRRRIVRALKTRRDIFPLEEMIQAFIEENPRLDRPKAEALLRRICKPLGNGLWGWRCDLRLLQAIREGRRVLRDVDLWEFIPRVKCPMLLLRGADSDLLRPEGAKKMAEAMVDCRVVEIPEAGHAVPVDNPQATSSAIVHFLS